MGKRKTVLVLAAGLFFTGAGAAGAQEPDSVISEVIQCPEAEIRIEAEVIPAQSGVLQGTLSCSPFSVEMAEQLMLLYGEADGWEPLSTEESSAVKYVYPDDGMGENSLASAFVQSNMLNFEINTLQDRDAEYDSVMSRACRLEPEEVLELFGLDAVVNQSVQSSDGSAELEYCSGLERIGGIPAALLSGVSARCGFIYQDGYLIDFYYDGNYRIEESEAVEVISAEQALEQVKKYADAEFIFPTVDRTVKEIELCYYLEETDGTVSFRPVWVFRSEGVDGVFGKEDSVYVDAQDGTMIRCAVY